MLKYLLLIVIAAVVWWVWQKRATPRAGAPRAEAAPERMVPCAHCGVLMPESDSLAEDGKHYCCEAHRRTAESGPR